MILHKQSLFDWPYLMADLPSTKISAKFPWAKTKDAPEPNHRCLLPPRNGASFYPPKAATDFIKIRSFLPAEIFWALLHLVNWWTKIGKPKNTRVCFLLLKVTLFGTLGGIDFFACYIQRVSQWKIPCKRVVRSYRRIHLKHSQSWRIDSLIAGWKRAFLHSDIFDYYLASDQPAVAHLLIYLVRKI